MTGDGVHEAGSPCYCLTPKVVWSTQWGWRARRVPGVFFPDQASAMNAYIGSSAAGVIAERELDEMLDAFEDEVCVT